MILAYPQKRADTSLFPIHVTLTRLFSREIYNWSPSIKNIFASILGAKTAFVPLMVPCARDCLFKEHTKQFHENDSYLERSGLSDLSLFSLVHLPLDRLKCK